MSLSGCQAWLGKAVGGGEGGTKGEGAIGRFPLVEETMIETEDVMFEIGTEGEGAIFEIGTVAEGETWVEIGKVGEGETGAEIGTVAEGETGVEKGMDRAVGFRPDAMIHLIDLSSVQITGEAMRIVGEIEEQLEMNGTISVSRSETIEWHNKGLVRAVQQV